MSITKIFITSNIYHKICIYLYKYCIHTNTCNITMQRNDLKCRDYFFFFFFLNKFIYFFYKISIFYIELKTKLQ